MATIYGIKEVPIEFRQTKDADSDCFYIPEVMTLQHALNLYSSVMNTHIVPCLESFIETGEHKYFVYTDKETQEKTRTDIHLFRDDQEICLKQSLDFELLLNDEVHLFMMMVC